MEDFGHLATFNPDPVADRPGYVVVPIDKANGKVVRAAGLAGMFASAMRSKSFALIRVDETIRIDDIQYLVDVFRTRETTNVTLRALVRAPRATAEAAAEALYDPHRPPSAVFTDVLGRAINSRFEADTKRGPETLVERLAEGKERWEREIAAEVGAELALDVTIAFDIPPWIEARISWRERVAVAPKDAPHTSVPLTVSLALERTAGPVTSRLPRGDKEEGRLLRALTERAVRDHVYLYDYWFEKGDMEAALRAALDGMLQPYGHRIGTLITDPVEPPVTREEFVAVDCDWVGRMGRRVDFNIQTRLVLRRDGAGLYDGAGREERKLWLAREAKEALRSAMYGTDVFDLLPDVEERVEREVHARLAERAARIGHDLQAFVARPRLPEKIYLRVRDLNVAKAGYRMRHSTVDAEFEIAMRVRLKDLRPFADLWAEQRGDANAELIATLDERLGEQAKAAAARVMAQTKAEDYFLRFEPWEFPDETATPPYVGARLVAAISAEIDRICPDADVQVTLNRTDTKALSVYRQARGLGDLEVSELPVTPRGAKGDHEQLRLTLRFGCGGLDVGRLHQVLTGLGDMPLDIGALRSSVVADLVAWCRELLSRREHDDLQTMDEKSSALRLELAGEIEQRMREYHGVVVTLKSVLIDRSMSVDAEMKQNALPFKKRAGQIAVMETQISEGAEETIDSFNSLRRRAGRLREALEGNDGRTPGERTQREEDKAEFERVKAEMAQMQASLTAIAGLSPISGYSGRADSVGSTETPPEEPQAGSSPGAVKPRHPDDNM